MKTPDIVRKALRSVLLDVKATESEQRQAEALLDSLLQSLHEEHVQKMLPVEAKIARDEAMMDQLWRDIEDRHYDELKEISARQCLRMTTVELGLAIVCIGFVCTMIENARSKRLVETLKNERGC